MALNDVTLVRAVICESNILPKNLPYLQGGFRILNSFLSTSLNNCFGVIEFIFLISQNICCGYLKEPSQ